MTTIGKEKEQETYKPPKVKVVEIKARQVICLSAGGTQNYGNGSWTW